MLRFINQSLTTKTVAKQTHQPGSVGYLIVAEQQLAKLDFVVH